MDITGQNGVTLREKWALGPQTLFGVSTSEFPNLFMVHGPGSPSVRYVMIAGAEFHINFMIGAMKHMREKGLTQIVTEKAAEEDWTKKVAEAVEEGALNGLRNHPSCGSWYNGANVPGKPRVYLPYIGDGGAYYNLLDEVAHEGYRGYTLS